jgi:hypothetical protein
MSAATYFGNGWCFAAINASPMVSIIASCTPSKASVRCFKDSLAHKELGSRGSGLSEGLNPRREVIKSSFSA